MGLRRALPQTIRRIVNTTNAHSHATQHWLTQIMAALAPEPTSRRMAAMAATQGVYKSVNTRKLTAAVVDRSVVTPAPPSRI